MFTSSLKNTTTGVKMKLLVLLLTGAIAGVKGEQQISIETVPPNTNVTHLRNSDYEYEYVSSWPSLDRKLGSVSAVAFDSYGNVVIFHRGSHVWDQSTFNQRNEYLPIDRGPIAESTLLILTNQTGALVSEWGANYFYMPHGLTIDRHNNYWLTDVGLHQVFKFDLSVSSTEPILTLGNRFKPGNDIRSFCKPTSVAVLDSGDFFVADGYCNGRVIKFSPEGSVILSWGKNSFSLTRTFSMPTGPVPASFFAIPHALTYAADKDLLCVADREQGRVQCFNAGNGTFHSMYSHPQIGSRLFSVKYAPLSGGLLYIINGPQFIGQPLPISGFVLSMVSGEIVGKFSPSNQQMAFSNPHELSISPDGGQVYVAELSPTKVHKFTRKNYLPDAEEHRSLVTKTSPSPVPMIPMGPDEPTVVSDSLYASTLTVVAIVSSLLATSCLVLCLSRTICFKGNRRQRFSSTVENISLRSLNHSEDNQA
ncbi:peptidyl-alpha-hydroxyglycine alpha-amidating lyase 1 [Sabethes cyaneus]|uniref:peptidyl-alpha-hydroxyglycine alpha-amidating lyase 1 n=1 Tax=Sabethes cyaneus TaxID=53552 RepID=UPI00237E65AD|nr:peptidyl-alpha-hydroxyglycine alpha-amidating lyase 1 [Sabethes cyaneus]